MGNYLAREVIHYCNVSFPKSSAMSDQRIDYYDFTFMLEGSMTYCADGVQYIMKKGDAIFLKPGTLRSRAAGEEPVRYVSFNFYAMPDAKLSFSSFLPGCITPNIRKLVELYPPSHLSSFYHSREKCTNMLNFVLFELMDAETMRSGNEHIAYILHYIEEHVTEKLTLKDISREVNLSREYLSSLFKRETGKTLTAYIHERKLRLAKEWIIREELSLTDIAALLGYENYNYFSRLFKRYMETTPMQLRKR